MIFLIQILRLLDDSQKKLFVSLFNDLSFEIDDLGYKGIENELVNELLMNHLNIELENESQLNMLTNCILKNQGKINDVVKNAELITRE